MKRVLLLGVLIGAAYFLLLAVLMTVAIAPGTDNFRVADLQSPWFQIRIWLGQNLLPPMAAIMSPLVWLLRPSTGDTISWFIIVPYVLVLGVVISLACHGLSALARRKT